MGNVYQPTLKSGQKCAVWWISYYANGRRIKESTQSEKKSDATQLLKLREGTVAKGEPVMPRQDRVTYETCRTALEEHYRAKKSRDITEFLRRVKHLDTFFAGRRVASITQDDVDQYSNLRYRHHIQPGTVRRELGSLTKMLRLAYKTHKLARLPLLEKPEEGKPRSGFFELEQYQAVRRHLPEDLQVAISLSYTLGWRMQSEVLVLERRQLDLTAGTVRLDPGSTKNDEGRIVYLPPELITLLTAQEARLTALEKRLGQIIPFLFPRLTGRLVGTRKRDFRKAGRTACKRAGVMRYRHDFRRTAVRNMVNNGITEKVAMTITGHKTRSVFDRYNIVSPGQLQEAAAKLGQPSGPVSVPFRGGRAKTRSLTR